MLDELVDILDERGRVIGTLEHKDALSGKKIYEAANTIIVHSNGDVLLHRRSDECALYSGQLDIKIGGVKKSGENLEKAAYREVREELKLDENHPIRLIPLFSMKWRSEVDNVNRRVYGWQSDGPFKKVQQEEIDSSFIYFVPPQEIETRYFNDLSPPAQAIWTEYRKLTPQHQRLDLPPSMK